MLIPYKQARTLAAKYENQGFTPNEAMHRAMREIAGVPPPVKDAAYYEDVAKMTMEAINPPKPEGAPLSFGLTFVANKFMEQGFSYEVAMDRADKFMSDLHRSVTGQGNGTTRA